ncbi:hypothetical protein TRVL_08926 [Trypanosoma vivax]|nr:hypothetical protein TRVL_08926 [Trypanosoma vivax]
MLHAVIVFGALCFFSLNECGVSWPVGAVNLEGVPLAVDGAADRICNLSGALRHVAAVAEQFSCVNKTAKLCHGARTKAKSLNDTATKAADEIDEFVRKFQDKNTQGVVCLANCSNEQKTACTPTSIESNSMLAGCRGASEATGKVKAITHEDQNIYSHIENAWASLQEAISSFNGGAWFVDFNGWTSHVFGWEKTNCTITRSKEHSGELTAGGSKIGRFWGIRLGSGSYLQQDGPEIKWEGGDDRTGSLGAILKDLEALKTELRKCSDGTTDVSQSATLHNPHRESEDRRESNADVESDMEQGTQDDADESARESSDAPQRDTDNYHHDQRSPQQSSIHQENKTFVDLPTASNASKSAPLSPVENGPRDQARVERLLRSLTESAQPNQVETSASCFSPLTTVIIALFFLCIHLM